MAAVTIDESTRFVCILTFEIGSSDMPTLSREVQSAVEQRVPNEKGFMGSVVMVNAEESRLLVVSVWESAHAWSAAQYEANVGHVVSDVVETAKSYDVQTYQTITVVRP